jgi:hypothetical protein
MDDGRDAAQFAADLIRHFRDVLVAGLTQTGDDLLKAQASRVSSAQLMQFIYAFSETLREMKFAPHMRTAFEVCALKICVPQKEILPVTQEIKAPASRPVSKPPETAIAKTASLSEISQSWGKFCMKLPIPIRSLCARCEIESHDNTLKIFCGDEASRNLIDGKKIIIREALADFFKHSTPPNLEIVVREVYNKPTKNIPTPEPQPPVENIQIPDEWASFGQEMISDEKF